MAEPAVSVGDGWMGEGLLCIAGHTLMAGEAESRHRLLEGKGRRRGCGYVAKFAIGLRHGRVGAGPQHAARIRAVGVMAGDAILGCHRVVLVPFSESAHIMARCTKLLRGLRESLRQAARMGHMTDETGA